MDESRHGVSLLFLLPSGIRKRGIGEWEKGVRKGEWEK